MRPDNDRSRRLGQTDGSSTTTDTDQAKVIASVPDPVDSVACDVGGLLQTWLGIKLDEVDGLVDDARRKVAALPDQRQLWALFGEALVRLHCVELEVAGLRAEVAQLRQRGRAA
jgi:hypothetical protein